MEARHLACAGIQSRVYCNGIRCKLLSEQNIKNSISKFKGKVSNTIGYIEGLETNGSFEDNSYGKNIITNNEKNIVKVN